MEKNFPVEKKNSLWRTNFPVEVQYVALFHVTWGSKLTFWMFRSIVFNNPKVANIRNESATLFALKCAFEIDFFMLGKKYMRRKCTKQIMSATRSLSGGKCHISCNRDHTRVVTERFSTKISPAAAERAALVMVAVLVAVVT